jgi:hypothetical protein
MLYHISRQDLRGLNHSYSETSAFFDVAGGWIGAHKGEWGFFAYGHQPVFRREENAYLTGPLAASPAPVENSATTRELRAGAGVSHGWGRLRVGVAGEWTRRQDDYLTTDRSGSPLAGSSEVSFSGDGFGGQAGASFTFGPDTGAGNLLVGASVRFVPEITVEGTETSNLILGGSNGPVKAVRQSGTESGLSIRWAPSRQLRVIGGGGLRTTQEWKGFDVTRGGGGSWSLGVDFHDPRDPWTLRFGLGQEMQRGTPEPRSGMVGLGFGWFIDTTVLDIGLLHHSFSHLGGATSFEDRVVATVTIPF